MAANFVNRLGLHWNQREWRFALYNLNKSADELRHIFGCFYS
jgi:hypothetical protein